MKEMPILYDKKENCSGCTACYAICPNTAISMKPDKEGFVYPVINKDDCTRCFKCIKICPLKTNI